MLEIDTIYKKSIRFILAKINDIQLGNLLDILNAENHSKKNQKEPKREPKRTMYGININIYNVYVYGKLFV